MQCSFFFSRKIKFIQIFFPIISKWYPHFIHPLHTIIKRSIAYTQNYIAKCKKCISFLKKNFPLWWAKRLAAVSIFIVKSDSNNNSLNLSSSSVLPNGEVCKFEQYVCREVHMITRTEIISLECLWDCVPTWKVQTPSIAKQ